MTPEAQRIAIAEACGWRVSTGDFFKYLCRPGDEGGVCCGLHLSAEAIFTNSFGLGDCGPDYVIPDYLTDLNAMHEASVNHLGSAETFRYVCEIRTMLEREGCTPEESAVLMIDATAAQRAEAFLRTLNLWKDTP